MNLRLKVQCIEKICLFELTWGRGQYISCTLNYPPALTELYQEWRRTYLSFYQTSLRGRLEDSGSLTPPPIDWQARLVQAEAKLLYKFHRWLRSGELFDIRKAIANYQRTHQIPQAETTSLDLFLTCNSEELEPLPWETWEIATEFPGVKKVRLVRTPSNIAFPTQVSLTNRKARILVILGDETGLDFQGDRTALKSLDSLAEIEFVGWQPGIDTAKLKAQISTAITNERGWDVLFFAGHSNEMDIVGGEIAIAPHTHLSLQEITPQLQTAQGKGLQFALFNSCCGLSLAKYLINLGFPQVAVMREPVPNTVAQVFLWQFIEQLTQGKDVHDSLLAACQVLKLEKNLTYPSAYLIPSLFRHPEAQLFKISPPLRWQEKLKKLLPTPLEGVVISGLAILSLSLPVQDWLTARRVLTQAVYRQFTGQVSSTPSPPVLLVQIDEKFIRKANIADPKPLDRKHLAQIIDKLTEEDARVVGIDYLLDRPQGRSDRLLTKSLQAAIKKPSPTTFVFASVQGETSPWLDVNPDIASANWSLKGHIHLLLWQMRLVPQQKGNSPRLPFAYLLALSQEVQQNNQSNLPNGSQPDLTSEEDFLAQITRHLKWEKQQDYRTLFSPASQRRSLTTLSYYFNQMWLHPLIDFSVPPQEVYESISAWDLMAGESTLNKLPEQVVIIAPAYLDAGVNFDGQDHFNLPPALDYWFNQRAGQKRRNLTGGETHAYMVHHFLKRRLVVPIPDFWLVALAALLGKGVTVFVTLQNRRLIIIFLGTTVIIYGLVSCQVYVTAAILLPWLLPSVTLGFYLLRSGACH